MNKTVREQLLDPTTKYVIERMLTAGASGLRPRGCRTTVITL